MNTKPLFRFSIKFLLFFIMATIGFTAIFIDMFNVHLGVIEIIPLLVLSLAISIPQIITTLRSINSLEKQNKIEKSLSLGYLCLFIACIISTFFILSLTNTLFSDKNIFLIIKDIGAIILLLATGTYAAYLYEKAYFQKNDRTRAQETNLIMGFDLSSKLFLGFIGLFFIIGGIAGIINTLSNIGDMNIPITLGCIFFGLASLIMVFV